MMISAHNRLIQSVHGDRIRQARELAMVTQSELATALGVNQATVAKYENGAKQPSVDTLLILATTTGCSQEFFTRPSLTRLSPGSLLFRARACCTKKQILEARTHAEIAFEIALHLACRVNTLPLRIQVLSVGPEEAARSTRQALGLDARSPVKQLTRAFEKSGGVVLALPLLPNREAFATWAEKLPIVAIYVGMAGDRYRLTFAHELGHLVMHAKLGASRQLEEQAYAFAAELLMPRAGIMPDLRGKRDLMSFAPLKLKWGVSIQALIKRAADLQLISDRQYRYLFQQLGVRGWRQMEPKQFDIPTERPRLLRKMAELVYGTPINYGELARNLNLKTETVTQIIARYADQKEVAKRGSEHNETGAVNR